MQKAREKKKKITLLVEFTLLFDKELRNSIST